MSELTWVNIDPATLSTEDRANYEAYKVAQRAAAELRTAFEAGMNAKAPQGKRMVFGYKFGKLSVALDDAKTDKPKAPAGGLSLADFLKAQAQGGHRA